MNDARMRLFGILAGAVLCVGADAVLAQPAKGPTDQCFRASDVDGFNAPNDHTLYIRVGVREVYKLDLMSDCGSLTFRQSLGIETTPAGSWICSPLDATVVVRETGIPEHCPVTAIHKLTPDERAALPKSLQP